jgi:iron complex outermembrane recepter protein
MVDLSYALTPDLLLYTSASRGFREGDGQSQVPVAGVLGAGCLADLKQLGLTGSPIQYGPETVWSYELGEKAAMLDQRIILNSDIFYEKRSNTQALVNLSCGYSYFDNAASAVIYGTELELKAKLTRHLTLEQNASYIPHAAYSEANFAASITNGEKLLNTPNLTAATVLSYSQPLPTGYNLVASLTNQYTGHALDTTYAVNVLPAYDLVSARVGLAGDTWSAYLFGTNLTNRVAILTNAQAFTANTPALNRVTINQPLTIGIDISKKF